jgi:F-type H+-transporting ATPase subunit delta
MKDVRVAKRYAGALFGIAKRDEILDAVAQDMILVERFVADIPYLRAVLLQPLVSEAKKNQVILDAFGDRVTATSLNFIKLLVRKRREDLIDECIHEFRALVAEMQNRVDAVAVTAVPMTAAQTERLTRSLQQFTGKNVHLTTSIDPSMLGGTVVRLGDTVIDGSVRGRLARLEQQLLGSGY